MPIQTLYGMTSAGGANGQGNIFSCDKDHCHHTLATLYDFTGGNDGGSPYGGLTLSQDATTLYGTTGAGGAGSMGTLFSCLAANCAATFSVIHTFSGDDGANPYTTLTLSNDGTTLYGVTAMGGGNANGAIFSCLAANCDASYTLLHSFSGPDGQTPIGSLVFSPDGSTIYGSTEYGGANGDGTVYSCATNNCDATLAVLHHFHLTVDGQYPQGKLAISSDGSTLYGITQGDGMTHNGAIFSMPSAGGSFTKLHNFSLDDGSGTDCSLILSDDGTTLYGQTMTGGNATSNQGRLFSIPVTGGSPTVLYNFTGGKDGAYPTGGLSLSNGILYGATVYGGASHDGVIFGFKLP